MRVLFLVKLVPFFLVVGVFYYYFFASFSPSPPDCCLLSRFFRTVWRALLKEQTTSIDLPTAHPSQRTLRERIRSPSFFLSFFLYFLLLFPYSNGACVYLLTSVSVGGGCRRPTSPLHARVVIVHTHTHSITVK